MRNSHPEPKPKDPPDDEPAPVLLTRGRLANQLESLYLELARVVGRLEGVTHHVDSAHVRDCCNALTAECKALATIRGRVLVGEIPITHGEDRESWRRRQPLIAAIEERNGRADEGGAGEALDNDVKHDNGVAPAAIEKFFAGGETSFRYCGVPVWAVARPRQAAPVYGVVAATRKDAMKFVAAAADHPGALLGLKVRPLRDVDLRSCSVYYDARPTVPADDQGGQSERPEKPRTPRGDAKAKAAKGGAE